MATPEIINKVSERINVMKKEEGLKTPASYSVGNALNSAYLKLQDTDDRYGNSVLKTCTPASIAQSLLNMVIQGLSPAKNQCYFIAYDNKLTMQPSYFGNVTALKRLKSVKSVHAEVVFQDDEFETGSDEDFDLVVKKFVPKFENRDKPIVGAFAVITDNDGNKNYTIMTMKEIQQSWSQTRMKANKVQSNFGQEMAQRTVLNRASKFFVNTSDDSDLIAGAINQTVADEYEDRKDVTPAENDSKIEQIAKKRQEEAKEKVIEEQSNSNVSGKSSKEIQKSEEPMNPEAFAEEFAKSMEAEKSNTADKKAKSSKASASSSKSTKTSKSASKGDVSNAQIKSEDQSSLDLDFNPDKR